MATVRMVDPITDDVITLLICDTCGDEGHDGGHAPAGDPMNDVPRGAASGNLCRSGLLCSTGLPCGLSTCHTPKPASPPDVGDRLPNGAKVLDRTAVVGGSGANYYKSSWIVLADTDRHAADPFVTWVMDDAGNTFWGHYWHDITAATADYNLRIGRGY